jgi:hypothetical protein
MVREMTVRTPKRGSTGIEGDEANLLGETHPVVHALQIEVRDVSKIVRLLVVGTAATGSLSLPQGNSEAVGTAALQG